MYVALHNYLIPLFQHNNMAVNEQTPFTATSHMPLETYHRLHTLPSTNAIGQSQTFHLQHTHT